MKRVGLLGPGTFSEESAQYFLGHEEFTYISYKLISDVFDATISQEVDYGVIPVENTMEGSVSVHVDLLVNQVELMIKAEWVYPIDMHLIGFREIMLPELDNPYAHIKKLYSHHVVPAQCSQFMKTYLQHAEFEQVSHTSEAVRYVASLNDTQCAAIASKGAAKLHGMDILAEDIQNHKDNLTRFVMIGVQDPQLKSAHIIKTTIIVLLPEDYPGALHQMLSVFAWRKINLSKIESRPTKKKLGNYYFYIDLEGSLASVLLQAAIQEIEALGCQVRVLGSYPSYQYSSS